MKISQYYLNKKKSQKKTKNKILNPKTIKKKQKKIPKNDLPKNSRNRLHPRWNQCHKLHPNSRSLLQNNCLRAQRYNFFPFLRNRPLGGRYRKAT